MNKFLKQRKGITLISLVVTIIILIILAGISLSLIMGQDGLIKKAKETKPIQDIATAKEQLEMLKVPTKLNTYDVNLDNYLDELEKVKKEYEVNDIEKISDIQAEVVVGGKYKFLIKDKQNGDVEIMYQGEATELILSETSGTYIYPTSGTFEVVKNITGGELSVKSENENIAKVNISGTTVTVEPGTTTGTVEIIVTSAANGKYAEQKAVYLATVVNGEIELEATAYTGNYDDLPHNAITDVEVIPEDAKIEYSIDGGEYKEEVPTVTGEGMYTISIQASKAGYTTKIISKTVTITMPSYTVIYNVDTSTSYKESVKKGNTCISPTTFTPTKSGYTFVGWRENNTASATVLTTKTMGDSAISLYAVFKKDIKVTYYNNSTTAASSTKQTYYNNGNVANPSFTLTQATRSGWTARGWSTGTAGNSAITYNNGTAFTRDSNVTLYGMYQQTITLSYNGNGSTSGSTASHTGTRYYNSGKNVAVNPTFTLKSNGFAKIGYGFAKWASGSASGTQYVAGASVTLSANTTFYAVWKTVSVTIISDGNLLQSNCIVSNTGTSFSNHATYSTRAIKMSPASGLSMTLSCFGVATQGSGRAVFIVVVIHLM